MATSDEYDNDFELPTPEECYNYAYYGYLPEIKRTSPIPVEPRPRPTVEEICANPELKNEDPIILNLAVRIYLAVQENSDTNKDKQ